MKIIFEGTEEEIFNIIKSLNSHNNNNNNNKKNMLNTNVDDWDHIRRIRIPIYDGLATCDPYSGSILNTPIYSSSNSLF